MLNETTKDKIFEFLDEMNIYIKSLSLNGKSITLTRSKTGFIGFLADIESLKGIYEEYVVTEMLKEIPTLRLSQDFLESFFGRVRALHGSNTRPTTQQFTSSFRKLLVNSEITSSPFANCIDQLSILSISSRKSESIVQDDQIDENHSSSLLEKLVQMIICWIYSKFQRFHTSPEPLKNIFQTVHISIAMIARKF